MKYCENYAALLDPFVDGELPDEEADRVRAHLAECEGCRAYVEMAFMLRDGFPDAEEMDVPDGFSDGVMAAIRANAAPRKKKTAPWVKVLLPLAACCAIVVLVQGISQNTGLWTANTSSQMAMDTAQAETEEAADALPDQALTSSTADDAAVPQQEASVPETYAGKTADTSSNASDSSNFSGASQAPSSVYYAETGPESDETTGASNRDISMGENGQTVTAVSEGGGDEETASSPQPEQSSNGENAVTATTTLAGHLAIISLTTEEAGDLLDAYTPLSQTEDASCYELSSEQYQLLLEQLAQREIVPENQLSEDQQVPQSTALVYVTAD